MKKLLIILSFLSIEAANAQFYKIGFDSIQLKTKTYLSTVLTGSALDSILTKSVSGRINKVAPISVLGTVNQITASQVGGQTTLSLPSTIIRPVGSANYFYNTSDLTNYERGGLRWTSNEFQLLSEIGGTGTNRSLSVISPSSLFLKIGSTARLTLTSTSITGGINLAYTTTLAGGAIIGSNPTLSSTSGTQYNMTFLPTIGQSSTAGYSMIFGSAFEQTVGSGSKDLIDLGLNSAANGAGTHTSKFKVDKSGVVQAVQFKLSSSNTAPASATDTGTAYEIRFTPTGIFFCIATNTWVKATMTSF